MAAIVQSLISLNQAVPTGHKSLNRTHQVLEAMRQHSPYTSRAAPSWAYIDDYLWYVSMWLDSYEWLGGSHDRDDAANTMDLSEGDANTSQGGTPRASPAHAAIIAHLRRAKGGLLAISIFSHSCVYLAPCRQWPNGAWTCHAVVFSGCTLMLIHARMYAVTLRPAPPSPAESLIACS